MPDPIFYLQPYMHLIPGTGITITVDTNPDDGDNEVTISATGGGGGGPGTDTTAVHYDNNTESGTNLTVTAASNVTINVGGTVVLSLDNGTSTAELSSSTATNILSSSEVNLGTTSDADVNIGDDGSKLSFFQDGTNPGETQLEPGTLGVVTAADIANALSQYGLITTRTYTDAASGGSVATDVIWDVAGDLAVGTGSNTAARLAIGSTSAFLRVVGGSAAWVGPSSATPAAVSTSGSAGTAANSPAADNHVHPHEAAHLAHDTIWDTKGDIAVATGSDTATKLAVGSNTFVLTADSGEATGVKWAAAAGAITTIIATDTFWAAKGDLAVGSANDTAVVVSIGSTSAALRVVGGTTVWVGPSAATPAAVSTSGSAGTAANPSSADDHVHAHEAAHINHDTTWAAKGDLAVGSANDTAVILSIGSTGQVPVVSGGTLVYEAKGAGTAAAAVDTSETTASTTYADLATDGPNVTVTIGISGMALVHLSAKFGTTSGQAWYSFAVGAATPADTDGIRCDSTIGNSGTSARSVLVTGLTPGSVTFNSGYRVTAGTGTFVNRKMVVQPL